MNEELTQAGRADTLRIAVNFISGYFEHDPMPPEIEVLVRRLNAMCSPSTSPASDAELPPLPEAFGTMENVDEEEHVIGWLPGYTAAQMRGYAIDALHARWCAEVNADGLREENAELRAELAASTRTASDTRTAALEEAAKLCDKWAEEDVPGAVKGRSIRLAKAIRALAAGEAECDAARRAAPASQHDTGGVALGEPQLRHTLKEITLCYPWGTGRKLVREGNSLNWLSVRESTGSNIVLADMNKNMVNSAIAATIRAISEATGSPVPRVGGNTQPESFAAELVRKSIAARTQADAGKDAEIAALARTLVSHYYLSLPNMYCDGEPVGRDLVRAVQSTQPENT